MEFNVYYKQADTKKLRQVLTQADSSQGAIELVEELLKEGGEEYIKPMLVVIKGGVHGV